jgi:hypothetical protein
MEGKRFDFSLFKDIGSNSCIAAIRGRSSEIFKDISAFAWKG